MTLFKKRTEQPSVIYSLNECLQRARDKHNTSFYYPLFEADVNAVKKWGNKNNVRVEIDHVTDGNVYYKFILQGETYA